MCWQFTQGFYKRLQHSQGSSGDWINDCYERGMLNVATKRIKLTLALVRGDPNLDVTHIDPPQLLDASTKIGGLGIRVRRSVVAVTDGGEDMKAEAKDEAPPQRPRQKTKGAFVLVTGTESAREHFERLHDTVEAVATLESEAGPVESVGEMSWRIKFGEGSFSSLVHDSVALQRFINDLQLVCGANAVVTKLEEG
jgi:hypothetical protein